MSGRIKEARDAALSDTAAQSVDALYRRHAGWLGRVLASRFRAAPLEVDDLVQETYVRVARYAPEDQHRQPRALLLRIATNLARDHMRRNVVRGGLSVAAADVAEPAVPAEQEEILLLKQLVLALPPKYRAVFVLSRFTGMTYEGIARHLGISVKTVEWRMGKALAICAAGLRD